MKKLTGFLSVSIVALLLVTSCSKEKRIERSLFKKGGDWSVVNFQIDEYSNGVVTYTESSKNSGTIDFSKNGTLIWTQTIDGDTEVIGGTWSNSDETVTMVIDGDGLVFEIEERSRNEYLLVNKDSYVSNGISYVDELTLELERN